MTKNIWQKSSEKTAICNTFDVLSHLLIFEMGSLPCRRHKFRHINTAEQFLNGSLHFLLLPIFSFIFTKVSTLNINLVLVFENRKNRSCSLLCPLYLELAHICLQQPGGELLGRFGSEWVDLSRCCWVDYLAVTHPPARPRYWLRRNRDRNRGRNLCKSISCTDSVPSFGTCFHVFLLKKSIITKWCLLGNVSREMSDVLDSHGRAKGAE